MGDSWLERATWGAGICAGASVFCSVVCSIVLYQASCTAQQRVRLLHVSAEQCVQIARDNGDKTMEAACQATDDLAPILERYYSTQRTMSCDIARPDAAPPDTGGSDQ